MTKAIKPAFPPKIPQCIELEDVNINGYIVEKVVIMVNQIVSIYVMPDEKL